VKSAAKILRQPQNQEDDKLHHNKGTHNPPMIGFSVRIEGEFLVADIVEQANGDSHHSACNVVIHPNALKQANAENVDEIGKCADHHELEDKSVVANAEH